MRFSSISGRVFRVASRDKKVPASSPISGLFHAFEHEFAVARKLHAFQFVVARRTNLRLFTLMAVSLLLIQLSSKAAANACFHLDGSNPSIDQIEQILNFLPAEAPPASNAKSDKENFLNQVRLSFSNSIQSLGVSDSSLKISIMNLMNSLSDIFREYHQKFENEDLDWYSSLSGSIDFDRALREESLRLIRSNNLNDQQFLMTLFMLASDIMAQSDEGESPDFSLDTSVLDRAQQIALASQDAFTKEFALQVFHFTSNGARATPLIHQILSNLNSPASSLDVTFSILELQPDIIQTMNQSAMVMLHLDRLWKTIVADLDAPRHDKPSSLEEDSLNARLEMEREPEIFYFDNLDDITREAPMIFKDEDSRDDALRDVKDQMFYIDEEDEKFEAQEAFRSGLKLLAKMASTSLENSLFKNQRDSLLNSIDSFIASALKSSHSLAHYLVFETIVQNASPALLDHIIKRHLSQIDPQSESAFGFMRFAMNPYLDQFGPEADERAVHFTYSYIQKLLEKKEPASTDHFLDLLHVVPETPLTQNLKFRLLQQIFHQLAEESLVKLPHSSRELLLIKNIVATRHPEAKSLLQTMGAAIHQQPMDSGAASVNSTYEVAMSFLDWTNSSLTNEQIQTLAQLTHHDPVGLDPFVPQLIRIFKDSKESLERRSMALSALQSRSSRIDVDRSFRSVVEIEAGQIENWNRPHGQFIEQVISSIPLKSWALGGGPKSW